MNAFETPKKQKTAVRGEQCDSDKTFCALIETTEDKCAEVPVYIARMAEISDTSHQTRYKVGWVVTQCFIVDDHDDGAALHLQEVSMHVTNILMYLSKIRDFSFRSKSTLKHFLGSCWHKMTCSTTLYSLAHDRLV